MQYPTINLRIRNEGEYGNEYTMCIRMPATKYAIRDVLQQLRASDEKAAGLELVIDECPYMPDAEHVRLDAPSIEELNFLARRLADLSEDEQIALRAVSEKYFRQFGEGEPISMKDLINLTYGLDQVSVIYNVNDDAELGQFAIENELNEDIKDVPESSRYLLDKAKIGEFQRKNDGGVFVGNNYVLVDEYKLSDVYDGVTLPAEEKSKDFIFRLEVSKCPPSDAEEIELDTLWLELPMDKSEANRVAKELGEERIEDCVYLDFESAIPQIQEEHFGDMQKFDVLNQFAESIKGMTMAEEAKFKAILEAREIANIQAMLGVTQSLRNYDFAPQIRNADQYFKEYLSQHLHQCMDKAWLDTLSAYKEGVELMRRLGSLTTSYGLISSKDHRLFEFVSRNYRGIPLDEKFELISVLNKTALFTNERISDQDVPSGLYKYELREGDLTPFSSIEKKVIVNYGGTVLVKEPLDFGTSDFMTFNEETSPNFLGEEVTLEEYLRNDYDQTEGDQQIGVIK